VVACPTGCKQCDGDAKCIECFPGKYLRLGTCTEYAEYFYDDFEAGTTAVNLTKWAGENDVTIYGT